MTVGQEPRIEGGGLDPAATLNPRANIATVEFKLASTRQRDISTITVMQAWRDEVGILPYVRGISFSGEVIDLGNPVEAVLSHPDPERLNEIADSVVDGSSRSSPSMLCTEDSCSRCCCLSGPSATLTLFKVRR